jgi:uncharacterized protein YggE
MWLPLYLALLAPVAAQDSSELRRGPVLSVKGSGRIEVKPDYAAFDVIVSTKGRTLEEAAQAHQERATAALAVLRGMTAEGLAIERSTFHLNQDRPPPPVPQVPGTRPPPAPAKPAEPPYTAQTTFSLRLKPVEALNAVASRLAASGHFEMRPVSFQVEQERNALNQARRAAMLDAREQAEAYADAGGLRLVEIIEVTDGEASPLNSQYDLPRARFVQIIPPATVAFNAGVNVTWRIAPR